MSSQPAKLNRDRLIGTIRELELMCVGPFDQTAALHRLRHIIKELIEDLLEAEV